MLELADLRPSIIDLTPSRRNHEGVYADGKVRVINGHRPRTTIAYHRAHLVVNKFDGFEFNKAREVNEVDIRFGHQKGQTLLSFADRKDGSGYEYDVYSKEGVIIGQAYGMRVDLLIAHAFYDDQDLLDDAGDARLDESVINYLKRAVAITAGSSIHEVKTQAFSYEIAPMPQFAQLV